MKIDLRETADRIVTGIFYICFEIRITNYSSKDNNSNNSLRVWWVQTVSVDDCNLTEVERINKSSVNKPVRYRKQTLDWLWRGFVCPAIDKLTLKSSRLFTTIPHGARRWYFKSSLCTFQSQNDRRGYLKDTNFWHWHFIRVCSFKGVKFAIVWLSNNIPIWR